MGRFWLAVLLITKGGGPLGCGAGAGFGFGAAATAVGSADADCASCSLRAMNFFLGSLCLLIVDLARTCIIVWEVTGVMGVDVASCRRG